MPSYRFCRPDDIPLLVSAVNSCFDVHFPEQPAWTVEALRTEMKELDLWPSNSMVAIQGDEPVAVMIGTKRADEVLISRVGVRAAAQRQGHASHLVTSLGQKLAVLGPERLVAEVPVAMPSVVGLFESLGYVREARLCDYHRAPSTAETAPDAVPDALATPIAVADLVTDEFLCVPSDRAWQRSAETLRNQGEHLQGVGIVTPERIEAFLVFHPPDAHGRLQVVGADCRDPERSELLLGLLFRWLAGRHPGEIVLPRLVEGEIPPAVLERLGFTVGAVYDRYAGVATPA